MQSLLGIRREDKNRWERRVPIVPADLAKLVAEHGIQFAVQPSERRIFPDEDYERAGAEVTENVGICPVVFGVKEMPVSFFQKERTYIFFSHTIKGQPQNMPMLKRILELGCDLIDYEKVTDDQGRRLIFFGRHAGLAGMIDSLWGLGQRLKEARGLVTPLTRLQPAHAYRDLAEAKAAVAQVGASLREQGIPEPLRPLVIGLAGYGHVSQGAQEILNALGVVEASPEELLAGLPPAPDKVFQVVFREEHMVEPKGGHTFELQDYYDHPEKYEGVFSRYLDKLTVLVNCIYWDERYPRLLTKKQARDLAGPEAKLLFVGDISCDIEGGIEITVQPTTPDDPVFVYDPTSGEARSGFSGPGLAVLAVDNLPAELPKEASEAFSHALTPFVPAIAEADMRRPLDQTGLPPEFLRAVIVHRGQLTPAFKYLEDHLP